MEKHLRWIVFSVALTISACSPINSLKPFDDQQAALVLQQNYNPQPAKERIRLALPKNTAWRRIDLSRGTLGTPIMLVPHGQNEDQWTESFVTELKPYFFNPDCTAKKYMEERIHSIKKQCQHVSVQSTDIKTQTVTFTVQLADCVNARNQTEVTKAFTGIDAVYVVRYSAVTNAVKLTAITAMAHVINTAKLIHDPRSMTMPPRSMKKSLSFLFNHD